MSSSVQNRRGSAGLLVCMVAGTAIVLLFDGYAWLEYGFDKGGVELLVAACAVTILSMVAALVLYIPYGFIALGWLKIGQHDREELAQLPDDNTVGDPVEGEIRLGQFLKLASLADSGAEARELISDGEVRVDGEVETRRGRRLHTGARIEVSTPTGVRTAVVG